MSQSDDELLAEAIGGNVDALSTLLKQHAGSIRRALTGQIPKQFQAVLSEDDVIQQTFVDAFRDIDQFNVDHSGSFTSWLIRLATCNLRDAIRMLQAEKRGGDRKQIEIKSASESHVTLLEVLTSSMGSPSRHASQDELRTILEDSIEQLPQTYRLVVRMHDLEGLPVSSIAEVLGRSKGAVYMIRARAHVWLRDILGESKFYSDFA